MNTVAHQNETPTLDSKFMFSLINISHQAKTHYTTILLAANQHLELEHSPDDVTTPQTRDLQINQI